MSRNRTDLRFKALSIVLGGDVGIPPSDEDAAALDGYIDNVLEELNDESIVYIADVDDIPNAYFNSLAKLVANAAADEFGGAEDPRKELAAKNRLRVLARQQPGYGPQQTEYF